MPLLLSHPISASTAPFVIQPIQYHQPITTGIVWHSPQCRPVRLVSKPGFGLSAPGALWRRKRSQPAECPQVPTPSPTQFRSHRVGPGWRHSSIKLLGSAVQDASRRETWSCRPGIRSMQERFGDEEYAGLQHPERTRRQIRAHIGERTCDGIRRTVDRPTPPKRAEPATSSHLQLWQRHRLRDAERTSGSQPNFGHVGFRVIRRTRTRRRARLPTGEPHAVNHRGWSSRASSGGRLSTSTRRSPRTSILSPPLCRNRLAAADGRPVAQTCQLLWNGGLATCPDTQLPLISTSTGSLSIVDGGWR